MLEKACREEDYEFTAKALSGVLKIFRCSSAEELCALVGKGNHTAREVLVAVYPGVKQVARSMRVWPFRRNRGRDDKTKKTKLPIKGLIPGMAVHYAQCCHPLPGERIVGIVTTGKGVTVHTIDCETL